MHSYVSNHISLTFKESGSVPDIYRKLPYQLLHSSHLSPGERLLWGFCTLVVFTLKSEVTKQMLFKNTE